MKLNPKINPVRLIRRNKIPVDQLEPVHCDNCDYEFKGHFCPNCGQEVAEFNRPIGFIIYDFVGNFFAFDSRFFTTFKYLLIRPGFLTTEFFKGRRMRYSPPFRIFVFLSFVLFLVLQILTERSLDAEPEPNQLIAASDTVGPMNRDSAANFQANVTTNASNPSDLKRKNRSLIINGSDSALNIDIGGLVFGRGKLRDKLERMAENFETRLKTIKDPAGRRKIQLYISMCRNPEMAISNLLKYLSWAFFLLLPLFALILKLFYIRRKQNYIRHLIFSIHVHSFLFFILVIITGLRLIFDSGLSTVNGILLVLFPVYFVVALKKFYGQRYLKSVIKFLGISAIYNVLLVSVVFFVFLKSLQIV